MEGRRAEKLEEGIKYPAIVKWNRFVKSVKDAKSNWDELQKSLDGIGQEEMENRYPDWAQKHLGRFRKVEFHWMMPMFVDYYRASGGLDEMFIVLPPSEKIKEKEKKDVSKD